MAIKNKLSILFLFAVSTQASYAKTPDELCSPAIEHFKSNFINPKDFDPSNPNHRLKLNYTLNSSEIHYGIEELNDHTDKSRVFIKQYTWGHLFNIIRCFKDDQELLFVVQTLGETLETSDLVSVNGTRATLQDQINLYNQ